MLDKLFQLIQISGILTALTLSGCASNSSLISAVENGDITRIQQLIDEGADVNVQDEKGYTALMYATGRFNPECAILLLENGAKVEIKDPQGNTALMCNS